MASILTLVSGVIIAQAINFAGTPFIGRVYEPSAIGDYALITANSAVIMAIACLGMMTVFLLPKSDDEASGLGKLVTGSTIIISGIIIVIIFFCSDLFKIFTTEDTPYEWSLLILWAYIILYTMNNICYAFANRKKLYKAMFWNPIIGASSNIILGIIFGILGWGFVGYTLAHMIGFIINILHLIRYVNPYKKVESTEYRWKELIKSYSRFPKYQMPANLINVAATQMPVQMIGLVFGATILGMYSMCTKIIAIPATLLATPINRVYFKEINDRHNEGKDIGEFTFKILKTNIKIALIPLIIITIFGEQIFKIFLGDNWGIAGQFASILTAYELVLFCSRTVSGGLVVLGRNNINLFVSIGAVTINAIIFLIVAIVIPENYILAVWCVTLSGIIVQATSLGIFLKLANLNMRKYIGFLLLYVALPYGLGTMIKYLMFG